MIAAGVGRWEDGGMAESGKGKVGEVRSEAGIWAVSLLGMCGYMVLKLGMLHQIRKRRQAR